MKNHRIFRSVTIGFMVFALMFSATFAIAKDKIINLPIDSVTSAIDKNGNAYTRIIVQELNKLKGVEYTSGVAVMAFGNLHDSAQALASGAQLKAIVSERRFQGRKSYTLIKLIQ